MVRIGPDLPEEAEAALQWAAAEMQSTHEAVLIEAARDFLAERPCLHRPGQSRHGTGAE